MNCAILRKISGYLSAMFIITLKNTMYKKKNIPEQISLGNQLVWRPEKHQKLVLGFGSPEQWNLSEPLSESSVIVDLIEEAKLNSEDASDLWDVFLTNIYAEANEGTWHLISTLFKKIPVQISIADPHIASAVRNSLLKCSIKIKILENSF